MAHGGSYGATSEVFDVIPTWEAIWQGTGLEDVDTRKKIRSFLWENAHDIYLSLSKILEQH